MKTILLGLLTLAALSSFSQKTSISDDSQLECGFIATQQQLDNLENNKEYQKTKAEFIANYGQKALTQIDWVPIKVHITRTTAGTGGLTVIELTDALNTMNSYYLNANMQFYICDGINYIDDDTYYDFDDSDENALHSAHGVANLINIYFCNTVSSGGTGVCGYAYYPGGTDLIMMKNSCAINGSTLSHEMGHFYSLRHTHGGSNGTLTTELVDGSNCSTDGDLVCDTEADPQLGSANVSAACIYDGTAPYTSGGGLDANGDQFVPNPNNIMSYSRKPCRDFLSVGQYARIYSAHTTIRNYFSCPSYNVDFAATPTNSCTLPITVDFTDNSVGATSWEWDVDGDSIVDYTTQNASHVYTVAGIYDVRLTISDGSTDIAMTKTNFIAVGALGSVPYSEDYETFTAANNATGLMNGWTTNPANTTSAYRWNVDVDGTASVGTGPEVDNTFGTSTGHYMYIEASEGNANDVAELVSACIDLNVVAPELSFAYHMHGSAMGELHLDIYAGGTWTNDIMSPLIGQQTANQSDPYSNQSVDLTAWAGQVVQLRFRAIRVGWSGDIAIDDIDIQCAAPVADFTATTTTPCVGEAVVFTDASINAASWSWDFGAGATPATATGAGPHSVVYSSTGNKTVTQTAIGCFTDVLTNTNYLSVGSSSSGSMSISACDSYTSPSTNHTWTSTGIYSDTIPNAAGCDSTITIDLTVNYSTTNSISETALDSYTAPSGAVYTTSGVYSDTIANAAGCDSIITIDLTVNHTGMEELNHQQIFLTPNPTSDFITIEGIENAAGIKSMKLLSSAGRVVAELKVGTVKIDVSTLSSGTYFLSITHANGTERLRFVKE